MKRLCAAALALIQFVAPIQSVAAADFAATQEQRAGAFGGFRLRVPLDGHAQQRQVRAGLTLAPILHDQRISGETRMRMGEGVELGLVGDEPLRLSIAGTPVSRLAQGPIGPDGRRLNVSTVGWIAIGVGVIGASVFALAVLCRDGEICGSE